MLTTSARANAFAALLDGSADHAATPALTRLAAVAGALGALPAPRLPAALASGREGFVAAAAAHHAAVVGAAGHGVGLATGTKAVAAGAKATAVKAAGLKIGAVTLPGWAPFATGAAVVAVAAGGVVVGTDRAMPGDPLYNVKRQVERAQVALAGGATAKAEQRLAQARQRLDEVAALLHADPLASPETIRQVQGVVTVWTDDVRQAAATLSGTVAGAQKLATFLQEQVALLASIAPQLPASAAGVVSQVGSLLSSVVQTVEHVLGGPLGQLTSPLTGVTGPSGVPAAVLPSATSNRTGTPATPSTSVTPSPTPSATPHPGATKTPAARPTSAPTAVPTAVPTALPPLPPLSSLLNSLVPGLGGAATAPAGGATTPAASGDGLLPSSIDLPSLPLVGGLLPTSIPLHG